MAKRAFFVIGPEGSGTNLLAEAFVSAGCHYNPAHNSHLDDYEFEKMPDPFVFRRSLPHAGKWPYLLDLKDDMRQAGFRVQSLLIVRDWHCTRQSVIRRDPQRKMVEIEDNMMRAIYTACTQLIRFIYVSYESFCLQPKFRRWLFAERLYLKEPTLEIKYANTRYYENGENYIK